MTNEFDMPDPLLAQAIAAVRANTNISVSQVQRKYRIGLMRAVNIIRYMQDHGIISREYDTAHNGYPVLPDPSQMQFEVDRGAN